MVNYIPVRADLSDLLERVRWALDNPERAQAIGRAGQKLAQRTLTRRAAVDRWSEVLNELARVRSARYAPEAIQSLVDPILRQLGAGI